MCTIIIIIIRVINIQKTSEMRGLTKLILLKAMNPITSAPTRSDGVMGATGGNTPISLQSVHVPTEL